MVFTSTAAILSSELVPRATLSKHEYRGQNFKPHCDAHVDVIVIFFILDDFSSSFHIWNQIEAILYRTWILKISDNGFDIQPLTIFHTKTET